MPTARRSPLMADDGSNEPKPAPTGVVEEAVATAAIAAAATFGLGSDVGPGGGDAVAGEVRPTA